MARNARMPTVCILPEMKCKREAARLVSAASRGRPYRSRLASMSRGGGVARSRHKRHATLLVVFIRNLFARDVLCENRSNL